MVNQISRWRKKGKENTVNGTKNECMEDKWIFSISLKKQWEMHKTNARNENMFTPGKGV